MDKQDGKVNETNEKKNENNTVSSLSPLFLSPFSDAQKQAVEMIEKLLSLKPGCVDDI